MDLYEVQELIDRGCELMRSDNILHDGSIDYLVLYNGEIIGRDTWNYERVLLNFIDLLRKGDKCGKSEES